MMENYADPLDRSVAEQDMILQEQLRLARKPVHTLAYTGKCHNCGEPLADPQRFCDADCRDDHAKILRSRSQRVY